MLKSKLTNIMIYGSLFSGIEAVSVAWKDFGKAAYYSEIDPFACDVLKHHYPDTPNYGDILEEEINNVKKHRIDVLVGGSPCQSFSQAGSKLGMDDPRGRLTSRFFEILGIIRPEWFLWENVPGVFQRGEIFGSILREVGKLGYRWAYRVLDAQYFGVPQHRNRVFLVGSNGKGNPAKVLFEPNDCQNIIQSKSKQPKVANGCVAKPTHGIAVSMRGRGGKTMIEMGDNKSYCLRTGPGYARSHVIDNGKIRILTPKEYERVQGFPDDYTKIYESTSDALRYKAIGNSMAVPVIKWIGSRIQSCIV